MKKFLIFIIFLQSVRLMPISVPVDNYPDVEDRRPNAYFNRLPNKYSVQSEDSGVTDEYDDNDDDDEQTDRPVINNNNNQYSPLNNLYSQLLIENKVKRKRRRRKHRRPCIPIQSVGSPLFNNRLKREIEGQDAPKTLGLLLGNYGSPFYGYPPPFFGGGGGGGGYPGAYPGGNRPFFDNVKPQSDTGSFGQPQYNPIGGYPCIPLSYGHAPSGGPLGFFGPGGLFDFGGGGGVPSPNFGYPQTVIINRPPLFGNRPIFDGNRPGGVSSSSGINSDGISSDSRPGFWGSVVDKLQEFVTSVNPQQVFTAIGDTLTGLGDAIQNAQPTSSIRQGYNEFRSLLFR